jgi:hypothetical protein
MNPKLEELRRRLLPPTPDAAPSDTILSNSSLASPAPREQQPLTDVASSTEPEEARNTESSPQVESLREEITKSSDGQTAIEVRSFKKLDQAIDQLFKPAQRCREKLTEIAKSSDFFHQLAGSTIGLFESLEEFGDHMRKLSNSFATMRAFQHDLGALAESFDPVRALHHEVVGLSDGIRIRLAQVARSLEPANALRIQAAELTQVLERATKLQAQFYELSKAFAAVQRNETSVKGDRDRIT